MEKQKNIGEADVCTCVFDTQGERQACEPSVDLWLKEAKASAGAAGVGMWLTHNGVVRQTPKKQVREGIDDGSSVEYMLFDYTIEKVNAAIEEASRMDGIRYIRVWLNKGRLKVGDSIMYILVGGDIRPHTIDCLQKLVGEIKNNCVSEIEQHT